MLINAVFGHINFFPSSRLLINETERKAKTKFLKCCKTNDTNREYCFVNKQNLGVKPSDLLVPENSGGAFLNSSLFKFLL